MEIQGGAWLCWGMALQHPLLASLAPSLLVIALAACGDSGSGSGGAGGSTGTGGAGGTSSTSTEQPVPKVHRATAETCTADRPAGTTGAGPDEGECMVDADCAAGTYGRCVQDLGKARACSYDECAADADCGGGSVCECRNPAKHDANVCVHGNCKTDADCQGGYCSPSAVTLDPFCSLDVPIGSVGYFCHTSADECVDDVDCEGGTATFPSCFFDVDKAHFDCFPVQCVN